MNLFLSFYFTFFVLAQQQPLISPLFLSLSFIFTMSQEDEEMQRALALSMVTYNQENQRGGNNNFNNDNDSFENYFSHHENMFGNDAFEDISYEINIFKFIF